MTDKYCINCIHRESQHFSLPAICKHHSATIDKVTGSKVYFKCKAARSHGLIKSLLVNSCGKRGRFYKEKRNDNR